MNHAAKRISLVLVLVIFALMAMGSSSTKSTSENKGSESVASVSTDNKAEQESSSAKAEEPKTTAEAPEPVPEKKDAYEVGEGKVVTFTSSIGTVWALISVPVTNTGETNLYLSAGTMDLEDAGGHLVDSKSMVSVYPDVLKPGETAWYYEETTLDEAPASEWKVIPHVKVKPAKVDCVRYEISDLSLSDDTYGGVKITGRVENTTDEDESMVYIVAFLYDNSGEFLGEAFTILTDTLTAGDKIGFSVSTFASYEGFTSANIGRYEVVAFPLQFQF